MPSQDKGWAWVIVIGSFISHCLLAAMYFATGVFTLSWKEDFKSSAAMTSLVGSTSGGFTSMAAPLGSYIINRWGCRTAHMAGGLLGSIGALLASQASSLVMIFVCYGVLGGIGVGLCYVPSVIVLSKYFKRKRGLAIGIASSGVGVGSFIFPILLEYLQTLYSWRGAMLILSSIMLNNCVCAMTFFPISDTKTKNIKKAQTSEEVLSQSSSNKDVELEQRSFECEPIYECEVFVDQNKMKRKNSFQILRNFSKHPWLRRKSSLAIKNADLVEISNKESENLQDMQNEENDVTNIAASLATIFSEVKITFVSQTLLLLKNPYFYLMVVSNVTMFIGMMIVYGLTPLRAVVDLKLTSEQGAFLVSIIGISNLVGRFSWGAIANLLPYKSASFILFIILRIIASVLTLLSPLATTYKLQLAYCSLIGLAFGSWSLYPLVLANMFGDHSLNAAFGYLEVFDGIGTIVGPTIGGYIYDRSGSYHTSFILGGSTLAIGTFIVAVGYVVVHRLKRSKF